MRPGFASWVAVWPHVGPGEYLVNFLEIRPGSHPGYRPVPLEFWEAMGLPIGYQSQLCDGCRDLAYESVILRTTDRGETWAEVGRCGSIPGQIESCFSYCSLPDGSILRALDTQYVAFGPGEVPELKIQRSTDLGTSWKDIARVMSGFFAMPCRLKRLADGTLVLLSLCAESFGPGKAKRTRNTDPARCRTGSHQVIFSSADAGRTWAGPFSVLQGAAAPEADFVELPSGDLLFLNSTIQAGPAVRQCVHRRAGRFVPGPVLDVTGEVPETFVRTPAGLLVGANRRGRYSCSDDEGETWHLVAGTVPCGYQPMIERLDDGRFLCVWHFGCDDLYGETDQFIGAHLFGLEPMLPARTRLELDRDTSPDGSCYLNAFTFTLTADGRPLADRKVAVTIDERYRDAPRTLELATDARGKARCGLAWMDRQRNIHLSYAIRGRFDPAAGDASLLPCESGSYHAYALTPRRGSAHRYDAFVANEALHVTREAFAAHPGLARLVDATRGTDGFDADEAVTRSGLTPAEVEACVGFLVRELILEKDVAGRLSWIWKVSRSLKTIPIEDDFV